MNKELIKEINVFAVFLNFSKMIQELVFITDINVSISSPLRNVNILTDVSRLSSSHYGN